MPATATAIAIIHFIGLAVFSRQFAGRDQPPGALQALLPRVAAHDHAPAPAPDPAATQRLKAVPRDAQHRDAAAVESHTAILAFPAASYVTNHGWQPAELEIDGDYLYVRLNGEQLSFSSSKASSPADATKRSVLSQPKVVEETPDIGLPHLSGCFTGLNTLKPDYRPPFRGAAVVVTFPSGVSTAHACSAHSKNPAVNASRADTQVSVPVNGDLVITAKIGNSRKNIVVHGDAKVIIGNLPTTWLEGQPTDDSTPHYEVYYAMGEANSGSSHSDFACAMKMISNPCEGAPTPTIMASNNPPRTYVPPPWTEPNEHVNYQCSNTQWP